MRADIPAVRRIRFTDSDTGDIAQIVGSNSKIITNATKLLEPVFEVEI